MAATDELSGILSRRQEINDKLEEGLEIKPKYKFVNVYTEFHEFSRKEIKQYELTFNKIQPLDAYPITENWQTYVLYAEISAEENFPEKLLPIFSCFRNFSRTAHHWRYLQYFQVYTQANCEMECLSNFTYARCGCVHFGMLYGPNMTVCSAGSMKCVQNAQKEMVTVAAMSSLEKDSADNSSTMDEYSRKIAMRCMCIPACTSIEYEAETSQADFDWRAIFTSFQFPIPQELNDTYMTRIFVFFKEAQFITSRRSELYGPTDFLANCGGLLGLFMGFSFLSVVEILYFLSLRIICLIWKKRSHKRVGVTDKSKKLEHPYID